MDQELKSYLDLKFAESRVEMNAKFAAVDEKFAAVDEKFAAVDRKLTDMNTDLRAEIEKVETNLLRAFHGWSRPMEIRMRAISGTVSGVDERIALVEERVSEIERRLPL
jgi:hypothetical protein